MRTLPTLLFASLTLQLGGCVIYGKDLVFSDDCGPDGICEGDERPTAEDTAGDSDEEVEPDTTWTFTPSTLAPGETRILTLSADPIVDYAAIAEVELYGDAWVNTVELAEAGLSVVATADENAAAGTVDALLVTVDGDGIWLEDALQIGAGEADPAEGSDQGGSDDAQGSDGAGGATDPGDDGADCG